MAVSMGMLLEFSVIMYTSECVILRFLNLASSPGTTQLFNVYEKNSCTLKSCVEPGDEASQTHESLGFPPIIGLCKIYKRMISRYSRRIMWLSVASSNKRPDYIAKLFISCVRSVGG